MDLFRGILGRTVVIPLCLSVGVPEYVARFLRERKKPFVLSLDCPPLCRLSRSHGIPKRIPVLNGHHVNDSLCIVSQPSTLFNSRRPLTPVRQQVGERRLRPHGSHARHLGVTLRHRTDESFEPRRQLRRRRVRREGCGSRRTPFHLTRTRLRAGLRVSHGWVRVRPTAMAGRCSSEIRTGCANQRPSGSVRGAASTWLSLPRSRTTLSAIV